MTKNAKLAIVSLFLLGFFWAPLVQAQADKGELDKALREELGLPRESTNKDQSKTQSPIDKDTPSGETEAPNPIQERYAERESDSPSATYILLKILIVLGILLGFGYWVTLRLQRSKRDRYPLKDYLHVLSSQSLGVSQSVQVIGVGSRYFVLGVGDASVTLISEITDPKEKEQIQSSKEGWDPHQPGFLETLMESLAKAKTPPPKSWNEISQSGIQEWKFQQEERLERIRLQRKMLEDGGNP